MRTVFMASAALVGVACGLAPVELGQPPGAGAEGTDPSETPIDLGPDYDDFEQDCSERHPGHPAEESLQSEHDALLSLFPLPGTDGVVEAVQDGSWFAPSTWSTDAIPGDGDTVLVPCGRVVWVDGQSDARLDLVAIDGVVHFAPDADTRLVADTVLGSPISVVTVGLDRHPVGADYRSEILIHQDGGPLDPVTDPTRLTKGVVLHGTVRITGQAKTAFVRIPSARAGDTSILTTSIPEGWRVGDRLVVSATQNEMSPSTQQIDGYHDEIVRIAALEPMEQRVRITLDRALTYDHVPPANQAGLTLTVPVANFSRNVMFGTLTDTDRSLEDGLTVPVPLRGHVMFMHNPDVAVKHAEFFELGRTDKSLPFSDDNVSGRYALHFHRTGVHDHVDHEAPDHAHPESVAEGNAVWGSPGWGIVQHDSHLDVLANAVFGVVGSGIVAEAGNETGDWSDNIVIRTTGRVRSFNAQIQRPDGVGEAAYQAQVENNSFIQGEAYGMKSRLLTLHRNLAVSANGAGFSFWPHGTDGPSHIGASAAAYQAVHGYDPYFAQSRIYPGRVATRDFSGNEVIASRHALNTSANKQAHRSDLDILIEDLLAWNVDMPIMSFYQQNYIIKDSVFIRGEPNADFYYWGPDDRTLSSASHIHDATDFKLVHNYFEGFDVVAKEPIQFILGNTVVGSTLGEERGSSGIFREGAGSDNDEIDRLDNATDWASALPHAAGTLSAVVDPSGSSFTMDQPWSFFSVMVEKTDSLGTEVLEMGAPRNTEFRFAGPDDVWEAVTQSKGYYQQGDGAIFMVIHLVVGDRLTGTAGRLPVAIELAFLDGDPAELGDAMNLGPLPAGFEDRVGAFEIVDRREIGAVGNQLRP